MLVRYFVEVPLGTGACIDVLTQLSSVTGAIRAVGLGLLDDHVRHCVRDSLVSLVSRVRLQTAPAE
jgi:DNA-binding FrmR family transcriptional regulator